jgi:hypothetical protein
MKPLPVRPLTVEDERIFGRWNLARFVAYGACGGLISHYAPADRRDAELMLTAQRLRGLGFTDRWLAVPSLLEVGWHAAGGALP